jgi:outer membrane protein
MKNLPLILNGLLIVAVAVLFYFQFSKKKTSTESSDTSVPSDIKIAFVSSDTILKYYDYFKINRDKLEEKGKKLDQDLRNRAQSFQNDYESYKRNVGSLTIGQAKAIEEDLGKKQQNLQLYQQSLSQEITNEEAKLTQALYLKITAFLKKYGQEKGLQLVLKYDPSSDILYGGTALDITKDVVAGLNSEYKTESESPSAKKDSAATKKK